MADAGKVANAVRLDGRILYLTEDPDLVRKQLRGEAFRWDPSIPLRDDISTDEITPAWVCYHYDATLGEFVFIGLKGDAKGPPVERGAVKKGGFAVVVSGRSKGCGSSREAAPYAEKVAGIRLVVAQSIEKIYAQNCENIGLLASTNFDLLPRIERGEVIPIEEFATGRDPISAEIVRRGGLFAYSKARVAGEVAPPAVATPRRPMNIVEKICARAAVADAKVGKTGVPAVRPGDALFARADVRFSHEYTTAMSDALFVGAFSKDAPLTDPGSVFVFRDHLTFLGQVMPENQRKMGLLEKATALADIQKRWAEERGVKLYGEVRGESGEVEGSEAICHNAVVEDLALPGQIVIGTDSHTCMAGCLGAFAFGVGSTDIANAWFSKDVRLRVPEVVRFVLRGKLADDVCAKDVVLSLLAGDFIKTGKTLGKVLFYTGDGLAAMPMGERATLTNMAVECGGFTGILEPDDKTIAYIVKMRPSLDAAAVRERVLRNDPDAEFAATIDVDVGALRPMVALPGDPKNGVPLETFKGDVKVDIAYGGSCTGGKMEDMDLYARVLAAADARGLRVAPGVQLYLQFGSQKIKEYARARGYIDLFKRVGATLVDPSCGACIRAGPGTSTTAEQVTVSAQNRNFPGRSGPGQVYLASPLVVAASAIAGRLVPPSAVLSR